MKPTRGYISDYSFIPVYNGMACVVRGKIHGHPIFEDWIRTSVVLRADKKDMETLNSIYVLQGPPKEGCFIPPSEQVLKALNYNQEN